MKKINLRDFYPQIRADCFISVSDEILETMQQAQRDEQSYRRYLRLHHAQYSLEWQQSIGPNHVLSDTPTPQEVVEWDENVKRLHEAIASLPVTQRRRIIAYYFLEWSVTQIAAAEKVHHHAVEISIQRGIRNIKKILEKWLG